MASRSRRSSQPVSTLNTICSKATSITTRERTSPAGADVGRVVEHNASWSPVLVQETRFSDWMSTGSGVLPFRSLEEAMSGVDEINRHYALHCQAARDVAEAYFDAGKVLPELIDRAMNTSLLGRRS